MLQKLLQIGRQLLTEQDVDKVLSSAIDGAIDITGAERGLILLFDLDGKVRFQTARKLTREDLQKPKYEISRTIIQKVRTEKKPVYVKNAREHPEFRASESVAERKILSVICLPIRHQDEIFGAVYLDNRTVRGAFTEEHFEFARQFADFISVTAHQALERTRLHSRIEALERELRERYHFETVVGEHPAMLEILNLVVQIADTNATVLIAGETGTGKELIARALHTNSRRKEQPFVPINCGALPEDLLESELFGHARGAFTGAIENKIGWFERADGGTVFLDEISEMVPALQVKMLRILQSGEFAPVGSAQIRQCDVRVVAATNKNLSHLVEDGAFRQDLFYRLNVIGIEMPPLRERKSDIRLLSEHFVAQFAEQYNKGVLTITERVKNRLHSYDFPGNVRELQNIMERAVILCKTDTIDLEHLPVLASEPDFERKEGVSFREAKQQILEKFEREFVIDCLQKSNGNISKAAKAADMDFKNFHTKMKKYAINPKQFGS
ncbi:sigma-54-dependent Fis family transcriptional regulator [candidate division KSB1 bacterium]|nr:sigma-54-dependent Fis family transcriptional regulator [candidate division KSB1 bacterium]NIR73462.1 sigma-54-dependent Fis family transcriptional regulator [candidate division KSB1 bacterium]NIS27077.1 sigma-54-dependent Fis family transcriptional regulator [candidate division KSB1 bacterium]NIT73921.1 sigma-54-dependent Fis family transcriptional regulator [candidate division KSB1 bacterium]NIU27822.1 sigma-54-dependent Fis family transcriptional regulator [candidate division KSB1 bacteri